MVMNWEEWVNITTDDDLANGFRVYREIHTGKLMKVSVYAKQTPSSVQ